jgi:hypothetical protein
MGRPLHGETLRTANGSQIVQGTPLCIYHPTDQGIAHRDVQHPVCTLYLVSRFQVFALVKQDDTGFLRAHIKGHSQSVAGKPKEFL